MIGIIFSLPLTGRDQGWGDVANMYGPLGAFGFVFKAFAAAHIFVSPPTPGPSPRWGREKFVLECRQ
ncbi:hypothetical protein BMS3Bbin10_00246 [bacterium BMS3Bbin10]|nr:hypothetical protein BMS3Bbin10_00246 [bacterium BMS3Bbin10]